MFATQRYSLPARLLHWAVAICVLLLFPLGLWATSRAGANLWDDLTNTIYAWHKTIGFVVLILMILRIIVRATHPAPETPSFLAPWEIRAAKSTHHLLYVMLFAVPLLGWAGVTAFPALNIFGGINLPAMPLISKDEPLAHAIFNWHSIAAYILGALVILHVGAALRHLLIKRDGVVSRMGFGPN